MNPHTDENAEVSYRSSGTDITDGSGNVFADLGFDAEEAANLKVRARLMVRLRRFIKERGMTQEKAAEFFDVSQPRISDLVNKKVEKFSIDTLVNMLTQAGVELQIGFGSSESATDKEDFKVPA